MNYHQWVSNKEIKVMFTDFWRPRTAEYIRRNALFRFLSKHFNLVLSEEPDFLFYSCFGCEYLKYNCIRIFYTGENVRPDFSRCDYAFSFDYPINERNYRLPLYRIHHLYTKIAEPRSVNAVIEEKKFCCFLASNIKAKARIDFFNRLSKYKGVDSGGNVLNNLGYQIPRGDETEWMSKYKFNIAFENSTYPGYTTEKLLHSLISGTIPVYWGNPEIARDFNTNAFINCHDYPSFEVVVEKIINLDQNNDNYQSMLQEPFLPPAGENEYCKEENIVNRFNEIFSHGHSYIPIEEKKRQRFLYPKYLMQRYVNRKIKPIVKSILSPPLAKPKH